MTKAKKKTPLTFAEILKDWRTSAGLTIYGLARIAGITKQYISLIESGQRGYETISFSIVRHLCAALKHSIDDLVELLEIAPHDEHAPKAEKSESTSLADVLARWKEETQTTSYVLAQRTGIALPQIRLIETRQSSADAVRFEHVAKLCLALGHTISELDELLPPPVLGEPPLKRGRKMKDVDAGESEGDD